MVKKTFITFLLLITILLHNCLYAQGIHSDFKQIIDTTCAAHPGATGIVLSVVPDHGAPWNYAAGSSDKKTKARLQPNQPVLLASNTKTYIAAAILKLSELHKLDITDSIGPYLNKSTRNKLIQDGYATEKITITHLLSHTSGINDNVDDAYFEFVNTHRQYHWTRDEQIDWAMEKGAPLAQPSDTFKYADINYLLLSEIIEQTTHQPFYKAVRQLLRYKDLKLKATWFTQLESKPVNTAPLAHQYWNKYPWDSYDLDPSWDLYGGGGMVATAEDLALFFKYLFEGKIIRDQNLIAKLYTSVPCKVKTNYCLGLRKVTIAGLTGYYHGGFWGTDAIYFPDLKTSIAIFILERSERDLSADICKAIVETIQRQKNSRQY